MKQCLIITAYKSVDMLRSLLKATHKYFWCYIHIDKKRWTEFQILENEFPDVFFMHKFSINWGGVEHLEVILDMLMESAKKEYNYVHIVSGEDYPTRPVREIMELLNNDDKIYCDYRLISGKTHHAYRRYCFYWPYTCFGMNYKKPLIRYFNLFCVGIQKILPFLRRNHIGEFKEVYWGFIWGTYPKYAIKYVLDYINAHPEFWQDLKSCKIPEELCFQTILLNSKYKHKVVNDNLRYWNFEGGDNSGPVYLKRNDLFNVEFKNSIFCRKVKYDSEVRRILEEKIKK